VCLKSRAKQLTWRRRSEFRCSASTTSRSAASLTCGSAKAGEPRATLRFDETIAGQAAFQPVQRGALTGISIGNRILTWREIDPDNFLATH
jgi:hypothetical protein